MSRRQPVGRLLLAAVSVANIECPDEEILHLGEVLLRGPPEVLQLLQAVVDPIEPRRTVFPVLSEPQSQRIGQLPLEIRRLLDPIEPLVHLAEPQVDPIEPLVDPTKSLVDPIEPLVDPIESRTILLLVLRKPQP